MIGEGVMVRPLETISLGNTHVYYQIYRCFHVWGRSWVVISFPLALWFADFGIGLWESWLEGTRHIPLTDSPFPTSASVFWGLIAAINTYTTGTCRIFRHWSYSCGVFTPQPM
jgi:hypothetical protein